MTAEREKVKNGQITDNDVVVIRNLAKVNYHYSSTLILQNCHIIVHINYTYNMKGEI